MNLYDIIQIYGLNPTEFRFVRHGFKEINPLDTYRNDPELFNAYQSIQAKGKFGKAKYIAVFAPYHGTQGLFLGVWAIEGEIVPSSKAPVAQRKLVKHFGWAMDGSYYDLAPVETFNDLSERMVIEWGGSTVAWVQKKDKEVVAILAPAYVKEFQSYEHTILCWDELVKMFGKPTSNPTWHKALRSVNGVYCITDTSNGKLYVGSAYGKNGIWGRWSDYAATGHGGNKLLIELLDNNQSAVKHFQYSILEILSGTSTSDDAVAKENIWKQKLGSKINGYNDN
ncbi:MAG: GIY-YIG nuclease family protein [Gammaproteobacteria bacterium]|nr:GIY-YIG nuclease family protein [Gammaproteobacteria bacterium]